MGFKHIRQHDAMQCGLASLSMICHHHGQDYSLSFLERYCHATNEGVSVKGIVDSAKELGLESVCGQFKLDRIDPAYLPAILFWDQNHFVVLHKISKDRAKFHIADPKKGKMVYSRKELIAHWSVGGDSEDPKGVVIFFEPGEDFGKLKDTTPKPKSLLSFISHYLTRYKLHMLPIFLGLALGCLLQLVMPFMTQWIVDVGIRNEDIGFIWLILLGELMIVVGRTATDFMRRWLTLHISLRINISMVSDFFIKILRLPMSYFDNKQLGDILQRLTDHNRVQDFMTGQILQIVLALLSVMIFGLVLFIYSRLIFAIFIAGTVVYAIWTSLFLKRRKILDYDLFEQQKNNHNRTFQLITSMQEIKLQNCERRRRWEWEDAQADMFEVHMRALKLQQTDEAGAIFINEVKNILITVLTATFVIGGTMSLGAMLAVQYIIGQLNSPIDQLVKFIFSLQDVGISLERISEIQDAEEEDTESNPIRKFYGDKSICLSDLTFRYDPHAMRKTIDGVSIEIPTGKTTAIVGASGSGKTTLIKLMLGYYPPESGSLEVATRALSEYNMKWWRSHCGVVMQDGVIFAESVERNIAVDDGPVDHARLEEAARIACIHDYIMSLPLKYNTIIGRDGVGLSQGQKQRILIARAVYKDPDFIFLDEATNALDAKNERAIVENLNEFYKGRTVVVVAHRLSTVRNADQIIVLDGGKVVETGSHATLIEKKGAYYNLVKNQLELGN
ncbi:MAG: peptidase domain-containing ABC transporter [Bacteroides sp.]|nr:peptidase domain-containing ABC transporter [Bacteroides sp.]